MCRTCTQVQVILKKFSQKVKDKFPDDNIVILEFKDTQHPIKYKCGNCGKVVELQVADSIFNRKYACRFCHPFRQKDLERTKAAFENFIKDSQEWGLEQSLSDIHSQEKIACRCSYCKKINFKTMYDYMKGVHCSCNRWSDDHREYLSFSLEKEGYILLERKNKKPNRIVLRHSCGYVYSTTKQNFLNGYGRCPKCEKRCSLGERSIKHWLDSRGFPYEREFPVMISGHLLRFDFFLPDIDLYIEFQGEQHYKEVTLFDKDVNKLNQRQAYDNLKRKYCGNKLLEIPYWQFDNIAEFYPQRFNDYPSK